MADWLRPTLRRRARMAQPVVAQWRDQRHASICLLHRASGAFLHRVCAGTIRSSKLDVQVMAFGQVWGIAVKASSLSGLIGSMEENSFPDTIASRLYR
jgi:hypothetical protein